MIQVVCAALAVGLSNFAASIGIGLSGVDGRLRLRVGLVFGLFEALMPVIGLLIGHRLASTLGSSGRYVGATLLMFVGLWTIRQARRSLGTDIERSLSTSRLLTMGVALSIDNLIVGVALGTQKVSLVTTGMTIAVVSVGLSLLGLEIGKRLGPSVEKWSEEIGGAVLVLVGVAIALGAV